MCASRSVVYGRVIRCKSSNFLGNEDKEWCVDLKMGVLSVLIQLAILTQKKAEILSSRGLSLILKFGANGYIPPVEAPLNITPFTLAPYEYFFRNLASSGS